MGRQDLVLVSIITKDLVVTCYHVLAGQEEAGSLQDKYWIRRDGWEAWEQAEPVSAYCHPAPRDTAILRCSRSVDRVAEVRLANWDKETLFRFTSRGYDGHKKKWDMGASTIEGEVRDVTDLKGRPRLRLKTEPGTVVSGRSGSPVWSQRQQAIVGIIDWVGQKLLAGGDDEVLAIPISEIRRPASDEPRTAEKTATIEDEIEGLYQEQVDESEETQNGHQLDIYQDIEPLEIGPESLKAAEKRLANLPTDALPEPALLPSISYMPLGRNQLFVGREDDLVALAKALKAGGTAAIGQVQTAAATGMGGIGKTQLASEFVYRYGWYFAGGVFWLSLADPNAVPAEVASCGGTGHMGLHSDFENLSLDNQVGLVLAAWRSPMPRLLVFDNCEDDALLAKWRPPSGGCRVLVTSRRAGWPEELGVRPLSLGVLRRAESVELLRKKRGDLSANDPDLYAIAKELGDLPLALHLASSYLARYRRSATPADYLAQLRRQDPLEHPSLRGRGQKQDTSATLHEQHVARTFALSYELLDPDNPVDEMALALLARAAYFAEGEPIPGDLLLGTIDLPDGDDDAELQVEDALIRLTEELGLLEEEADGRLRLHRLIAVFVQRTTIDDEAQTAVENTVYEVTNRLNKEGYPAPLIALEPHMRAVTDTAMLRKDELAALLGSELAYHLSSIGNYAGAQRYYERALEIWQRVLGEDHPDTALSLNNLGSLLREKGDLDGAQRYYQRALEIRQRVLGEDHPSIADSAYFLAHVLYTRGDSNRARHYLERALAIYEQRFGPDHPMVLQIQDIIATLQD
jgi:tetratricopeptide (TPR) repeat protein